MKTLKKVLVVLLSLLVLSAALFGCGAKDEPPTEPSDTHPAHPLLLRSHQSGGLLLPCVLHQR